MTSSDLEERLNHFDEIWVNIAIGVSDGPCGVSSAMEPPSTANPVLLYAWLRLAELDIALMRGRIEEMIPEEHRREFESEVKRFLQAEAQASITNDIVEMARERGWAEEQITKLCDQLMNEAPKSA